MARNAVLGKLTLTVGLCCSIVGCLLVSDGCRKIGKERVIHPGERREGVLYGSDRIRKDVPRGPEARWVFDGRSGQRVTICADSYEFDVYLLLLDPLNRQTAFGDNNGRFFNARIETVLEVTGLHTVVVCGANGDQFGTYWVSLNKAEEAVDWSESAAKAYYAAGTDWSEHAGARAAAWARLAIGQDLGQRRHWDQAERFYSEGLGLAEENDLRYCKWAITIEQGRLFARRRRYEHAVGEFHRALELCNGLRSSREAEAVTLIELGKLYQAALSPDLARVYFRSAAAKAEQYALPSTLAALYSSLSELVQLEDREKAIEYAEKAFSLREGLEPSLELKAVYALASLRLSQPDRFDEGLQLATRMRERACETGQVDFEVSALTLMSIAWSVRNESDRAIDLAANALALIGPDEEDPNPRRIALQLQADGEMARGNYQAAWGWCTKALQTVENAWAKETTEEMRRELLSQARAICTQIVSNLYALNKRNPSADYAREAFDYAERSRSRSLLEQVLVGKPTEIAVDPALLGRDQEVLERLSAVRGQLVLLRTSSHASRERLYKLEEERASLIAERIGLRAQIRNSIGNSYGAAHLSPLDAEQAQRRLGEDYPNSTILYYQLGVQESFLISLTPNQCQFARLPDWTTISKTVAEWRAQMSSLQNSPQSSRDLAAYSEVGNKLYRMLVQPAETLIRGRDLIIVPSDALCALAFEALVVRERATDGRPLYLIKHHAVSYTPSVSVLFEIEARRKKERAPDRILLLGDASDGGSKAKLGFRGNNASGLEHLPAAREEVLHIAELAGRHRVMPTVWLGTEASEEKFKNTDLSEFRFIHLATHGIADHRDGEASALTLAPDRYGNQDGVLTNYEASQLTLNAELVVLSGCETGIGEEAGPEGIVGFNRTFLISGAKCVCGSLWQVEDSWTQMLMTEFYRGLIAERLGKSHALKLAKLALLKRGANPSQWAPFTLVGSTR